MEQPRKSPFLQHIEPFPDANPIRINAMKSLEQDKKADASTNYHHKMFMIYAVFLIVVAAIAIIIEVKHLNRLLYILMIVPLAGVLFYKKKQSRIPIFANN